MRLPRPRDVLVLAENLREADRQEIAAGSGLPATTMLLRGINLSDRCMVVEVDLSPAFIFGRVLEGDENLRGACVWALGTDDIHMVWRRFLRESREWANWVAEGCHYTWNLVDCRNTVHIRWLQWLGFKMLREIPEYGVERRPFYEFARVECVNQPPSPS